MEQLLRTYHRTQYIDVFGRHVVDMSELAELIPQHSEAPTCRWKDQAADRLRSPLGLGAHVWSIASWDTLLEAGAPPALNLPTVFSLDGLLYVVQTDLVPMFDDRLTIMVNPLATRVDGQVLANYDPFKIDTRMGTGYHYLHLLRDKMRRQHPGLSFRLAVKHGIELSTVRVLDHATRGRIAGTTMFDTGEDTERWLSFTMFESMAALVPAPEGVDSVKAARAKVIGQ